MSELAYLLRTLRGKRSADDVAHNTGLSRESIFRIERGGTVKLDTVRQIAIDLGASRAQWLGILTAWLKNQAGKESDKLFIEPKNTTSPELNDKISDSSQAMMLFTELNALQRKEILFAMQNPSVITILASTRKLVTKKPPQ
jgi:transcriptional regulator with XRE-family HTH domain